MEKSLIYVYCILESPAKSSKTIEFNGLNSMMIDDFQIVFKSVCLNEFSEENFKRNLSDLLWVETNAREHVEVIKWLMEENSVIPFKFGTIYYSENTLRKFIEDYSDSLKENFSEISGKEEWAVKIYCDRKSLSEQIDELSEEAAELEKQIMASSPSRGFLLKRKKNEFVETEMTRICNKFGQEYYDEFRKLSTAKYLNNLLPKDYTGREDTMILNASFLVNKNMVNDFINKGDILMKRDSNSGFSIEINGPWPAFSFISIKENSNAE